MVKILRTEKVIDLIFIIFFVFISFYYKSALKIDLFVLLLWVFIYSILFLLNYKRALLNFILLIAFQYKAYEVKGVLISITDVSIIIILFFFILKEILFKEPIYFHKRLLYLYLFILIILVGFIISLNTNQINYFIRFLETLILFLILYFEIRTKEDQVLFIRNSVIIVFLISIYNIIEFGFINQRYKYFSSGKFNSARVTSIFNQPNNCGIFLVLLLVSLFILFIYKKIGKKVLIGSLLLTFTGILLTFSRAAILGMIVFVLLSNIKKSYKFFIFIFILVIILVNPKIIKSRETSIENRALRYKLLPKMLSKSPFIGTGLKTYSEEYKRLVPPERAKHPSSHSLYLQLLVETGIIGSFFFFLFIFSILVDLISIRSKNFFAYKILISSFSGFLVIELFIGNLVSLYFWIYLLILIKSCNYVSLEDEKD